MEERTVLSEDLRRKVRRRVEDALRKLEDDQMLLDIARYLRVKTTE